MADANSNLSPDVEEWRDIPGYSKYQVSNLGRVRSCNKHGRDRITRMPWKVLRPGRGRNGYLTVNLSEVGCNRRSHYVHHLVAAAFVGTRPAGPAGYDINHLDGNKSNNVATNLEYTSRAGNVLHAHRIGLRKGHQTFGEASPHAKLTQQQADEIRTLYASTKMSVRDLAKQFRISADAIRRILSAKTYLNSPGGEPLPIDLKKGRPLIESN